MNPEEYYKNKLEKVCENKINEISVNQVNKYWEIVKEATEQTFPSCKVVSMQKNYNYESLKCIQCTYDKSQIEKSQNKVCHYLKIGEHLIELKDKFIYYPEIHPEESEIAIFEATYIKEQISELEKNLLRKADSYQENVERILGLREELSSNFKVERIPFIYQVLKSDFKESSKNKDILSASDDCGDEEKVIETNEFPETVTESFENIDEYDEDCDEDDYEDEDVVEPIFCDFETSKYSDFKIEEPDFEEEFDYGEPDIDMEKGEELENLSYVDTNIIDDVDAESGIVGNDDEIVDYGFTRRINNHKREFLQLKKSRYGNLYAGQR